MTKRVEASDRSLALRYRVEVLAQLFGELGQLRDRVQREEAAAMCAPPYQRSSLRKKPRAPAGALASRAAYAVRP
jgi:hypothetical protein